MGEIIKFPSSPRRINKKGKSARERLLDLKLDDEQRTLGMWAVFDSFDPATKESRPEVLKAVNMIRTVIRDQFQLLQYDQVKF